MCASFNDVEHSCQQCGARVEDGRPFCPHCRAPQIHVQVTAAEAAHASVLNPSANAGSPEISQSDSLGMLSGSPTAGSALDKNVAVRAAIKAGVVGVFIGIIPFLGIVLTGALAVYFYHRKNRLALSAALGSRLGGAAGMVAFAINAIFVTIRVLVFHAQQQSADDFIKIAQRFGLNVGDPDVQASIRNLFTPSGLALTFFLGMMVALVLASVGGALASLFLQPRNTRL
jgi:hypothetical protein